MPMYQHQQPEVVYMVVMPEKERKKSTFFTASNNHEHSKVEPHTQMSSKLHQYDLLKVTAVS